VGVGGGRTDAEGVVGARLTIEIRQAEEAREKKRGEKEIVVKKREKKTGEETD
jgi:hypothetical protein